MKEQDTGAAIRGVCEGVIVILFYTLGEGVDKTKKAMKIFIAFNEISISLRFLPCRFLPAFGITCKA